MTRAALSSTIRDEIVKGSLRAELLLKLDFPGGAIRTTTAPRLVTYNSESYKPDGIFRGISGISERIDSKPGMVAISLNSESTLLTRLSEDDWQWARVEPYLSFMDEDYTVLDTYLLGLYYMSTANVAISTGQQSINMECEPVIVDLSRHHPVFPSSRDQKIRSAGDTYFDSVSAIQGMKFEWGGVPHTLQPTITGGENLNPRDFGGVTPWYRTGSLILNQRATRESN